MRKICLLVIANVLSMSITLGQSNNKISSHKAPDIYNKAIQNAQVVTESLYIGGDNIISFTLSFESPDVEFADGFSMTFPEGITINAEGTSATIGSAGINPIDGQTVSWGDMDGGSGWGDISYFEPREFDVSITIDPSVEGNIDVDWLLVGDGYGSEPHQADGVVSISPVLDYDMAVKEIDFPESIDYNTTVSPKATIENLGNNSADFSVTMTVTNQDEIDIFTDSYNYTDYAAGEAEIVEFADFFYAIPDQYTVKVTIDYAQDENNENNTLEQSLVIIGYGENWILAEGTIPTVSYMGASAQHGNNLYIIGGNTSGDNNEVSVYNVETETWSEGTPLPESSVIGQAITVGDIIYVARGVAGEDPSSDFWAYDTNADTWTTLATLPQGRSWGSLTSIGDDIYFVGGRDATVAVSDVYRYDISTDTWTTATSTPRPAWGGSLTSLNGNLYYVLGLDADDLIGEVLIGEINDTDPDDITWTVSSTFPGSPVFKFVAKPFSDNTIIFAGGNDGAGASNWHGTPHTWLYNIDDDTWEQLADKSIPINSHGGGVFFDGGNKKFVLAAGYDSNSGAEVSEVEYYLEAENETHIDPTERDFIIDEANDVFTTVFWMSAESVVSINDGNADLVADTDYEIVDHSNGTATLTVFATYMSTILTDPTDDDLVLEITFDNSNMAQFTIHPAALSVVSVDAIDDMTFLMGTEFANLTLPANVNVHLNNLDELVVDISWLEGDYDPNTPGVQTLKGDLVLGTIENPEGLQAEIDLHIEYVTTSINEDFEVYDAGTGVIPPYWDAERFRVFDAGGVDDSQRLSANLYGTTYNAGYWETPIIDIGSNPKFNFMYRLVDWSSYPETPTPAENAVLEFYVSDDLGETFTLVHTIDENNHTVSTDYKNAEIDMSSYVDDHVIIRMEGNRLDGDFYADFDNIMIGTFYTATFSVTDVNTADPIQDATINLYPVGQTEVAETLTTDELGETSIILGDGASFDYEIVAHGYYDENGTFAISAADESIFVSMTPLPTHQVSGSVVTNDDTPVNLEGATVTLDGYDTYEVLTDVNGDFLIEDVYEETYTITISYPGYESYINEALVVDADIAMGVITLIEIIEEPYALAVDVDHVAQEALFSWNNSETIMLFQHDGTIPAEPNAFYQENTKVYGTIFDLTAYPDAILSHVDFHHMQWGLPNDNYPFLVHIVDWDTYTVIETVGPLNTNVNDDWETDVMLGDIDFSAYSQVGILIQPQGGDPTDAYPCLSTDATGPGGMSITAEFGNLGGYTVNSAEVGDFFINLWIETAFAEEEVIKLDNVTANSIGVDNSRKGEFVSTASINPVQNAKASNFNSKAFLGYNVYLDGADTPSNAEPILAGTEYLFEGLAVGMHTASVEATYSTGTSSLVSIDFEVLSTHQVTYSVVGENGAISATVNDMPITSGDLVVDGDDIVFTATPDVNYQVKEWIVNGDVIADFIDANFTYASIAEDVNVTVEFEHITHEVLFDVVGENGTIEATVNDVAINSGDMVMQGVDVLFTATPDDGYIVKSWTVNSTVQGGLTDLEYLHENLQEPLTVAVEFEVDITNVPSEALSNLYAYPNPFTNQITISNTENVQRIVITNLVGQQVMDVRLNGETEINTDQLSEGVYLVTFVANNGEKLVKKMIKQ